MSNSANNQCEKQRLTTKTINQSGQVLTISGCHQMDEVFVATSTLNTIPTTNVHGYMKVVGEYHEVFATQLVKAGLTPVSCKVTPDVKNPGKYTKMTSSLSYKAGKIKSLYATPWNDRDLVDTFSAQDTTHIAILIGPIRESRDLIVLDFETPEIMSEVLKKLETVSPEILSRLRESYTERTMHGGHHILLWVPPDIVKKRTGLAWERPTGKGKQGEVLIEVLGGKNSFVIIAPSPRYQATNRPLLNENGAFNSIAILDSDQINMVLSICRTFDKSSAATTIKPITVTKPIQITKSTTYSPENTSAKNRKLNEYLLSKEWSFLLDHFGYRHKPNGHGGYHVWHPNSTNFNSPNCTAGPKESGDGNTFKSWSTNWSIGFSKPISALTFWTANGGKYSEVCRMAKANGIKLEDDVDESRFREFQPPDQTETKSSEASGDMVSGSSIEERRRIARETRDALRSPVENSLINFCTDLIRESADSKHTSQVIPGATTLTHLGDFSSKWISYQNNVPVLHAIITAKTGAGKEHPARIFEAVGPKLNKIYRWHEANYGPNGKIKDHSDCKLYPQDILPNPTSTLVPMSILTPTSTESDENIAFADCRKENKKPKKKSIWGRWPEDRIINPEGSKEGVMDAIKGNSHCVLYINEYGDFLKECHNKKDASGDRKSSTKQFFKKLFDCPKKYVHRAKASKGGGKSKRYVSRNLKVSIIRYTTPKTFLKYFDLDSIEGGGVNRDLYFSETVNWMDNENWNRPRNRHGREKIIPVIAQKIFETEKFYHYQMNVLGNKITASDAYLKALKEYDDAEIRREIQAEIDGTDEEEAGVTARAGMLIGRIALIHMYSRMSMVLDAVDFNYGLQVVEASIKTAYRFLHEAKKLRSQNSNNNNIEGELKKIAECMKKYSEKNGIIKPSIIADRAFRNQKMGVENFKANYEGKLIAKEWIEIEGSNYRLTDKFRRDNP